MARCITLVLSLILLLVTPISNCRSDDFVTQKLQRIRLPRVISSFFNNFFRRAQLLVRENTRAELKLTDDQAARIDNLLADWAEAVTELHEARRGTPSNEAKDPDDSINRLRNEARIRDSEKSMAEIRKTLTEEQLQRLEQLVLQLLGHNAVLAREPAINQLNLDEAQMTEIRKIRPRGRPGSNAPGEPTAHEKFLAILTPAQRDTWDKLLGEPFFPASKGGLRFGSLSLDRQGLRSPLSSLEQEHIRAALKFTVQQQELIADPIADWLNATQAVDEQLIAGAEKADLEKFVENLNKSIDRANTVLDANLTESQFHRLEQLRLQSAGIYAFVNRKTVESLNLTDAQQDSLRELAVEYSQAESQRNDDKPRDEHRAQAVSKALQILTEVQRKKWAEMIGDPIEPTNE